MEVGKTYSIAYKGLKPGLHDFDFKVGRGLFEAFSAGDIKDGACDVHVRLDRAETQLVIDVRITGHVVVECDRCLEDCRIPVDYDGRLLVLTCGDFNVAHEEIDLKNPGPNRGNAGFSDEEREYDGDVLWLSPVEDEVDLMQYIYESIVLSLPYQRVHPEGECNPEMMRRFRIVSGEEFAGIEARAREQAEESIPAEGLSKLAALKAEMEAAERVSGTGKEEKQRE